MKWENGQAVSVMQTNSDLSDLDAEMVRELLNTPNSELSSGGPADKRQQTEQAARRLLK